MNALNSKHVAATILGLALLVCGDAAIAQEPGKRINFEDLDPAQPADVAVMYERITTAARMVCRDASAPWDGRQQRNFQLCVKGAIDHAVMDVNLTALTDLHQGTSDKLATR
jgi:UrcA family protein